MGKTAKKETSKRVPFNWPRLKKMWDEGKSYLEMAKALDVHFNPEGDDPTKSIRAKCSVAMNKGVRIDGGKLIKFTRRDKAKKEPAPKKATQKKAAKPTTKKAKSKATTKPTVVAKTEEPKPQPEA